jgi:hypothetical protein
MASISSLNTHQFHQLQRFLRANEKDTPLTIILRVNEFYIICNRVERCRPLLPFPMTCEGMDREYTVQRIVDFIDRAPRLVQEMESAPQHEFAQKNAIGRHVFRVTAPILVIAVVLTAIPLCQVAAKGESPYLAVAIGLGLPLTIGIGIVCSVGFQTMRTPMPQAQLRAFMPAPLAEEHQPLSRNAE